MPFFYKTDAKTRTQKVLNEGLIQAASYTIAGATFLTQISGADANILSNSNTTSSTPASTPETPSGPSILTATAMALSLVGCGLLWLCLYCRANDEGRSTMDQQLRIAIIAS